MNPLFHTGFSISDSLKSVRKNVLIYETIIKVTFKSSNSNILTVSSKGVVTVKNPGEEYVTVRMYDSAYFKGTSVKIKFDIVDEGETPEENNTPEEDNTQNPEKETEKTTESKCYNKEEYT